MHRTSNIFGTQLQLLGVFQYHETIQSLTSRKWYTQKMSGCGTEKYIIFYLWGVSFLYILKNLMQQNLKIKIVLLNIPISF